MTEDERAADYAAFIAGLPPEVETDLITSEAVSTAFFQARSAGWTTEQLIGDAMFAMRGGRGVGNVVTRLRGLAQARPVDRSAVATVTRIHRHRWAVVEGEWCPCGEQPPHKIPPALTPEHTKERSDLIDRIAAERPHPDVAEQWMRELIVAQGERAPQGGAW